MMLVSARGPQPARAGVDIAQQGDGSPVLRREIADHQEMSACLRRREDQCRKGEVL